MCVEGKFWRLFRLIEVLDQRIKDLFLSNFNNNSFESALEKIEAEDNKNEILLFIIYKFYAEKKKDVKSLYFRVKFMYDWDEVISYKIKAFLS
jgi:hypothetical protein